MVGGSLLESGHVGDRERILTQQAPAVIFLAGSGRSGSTLLERMLGGIPGFVNVGELIDLFRRVYDGDELCGCGERFSQCPFWREVGERAFGGWESDLIAKVAAMQLAVARQRFIPRHLSPVQGEVFRRVVGDYRGVYAELYRAIATTAGVRVVVDASKWPAQALALSGGGIDLRVIHMIRDVRGVAWSMSKRDVSRPQATRGPEMMFNRGLVSAATRWSVCQAEVDAVRMTGTRVATVDYEPLARQPRAEVSRALQALDLPVTEAQLGHLGEGEAKLGRSHGLSGNPSRFTDGVTLLRVDEEWRTQMSKPRQAMLGLFALPHRARRALAPSERRLTGSTSS